MEQSQNDHNGPLRSQAGPSQPILAIPNLNQGIETGSMLAWVCWDEFVNLESPYTVRWMEKCNDAHIAALRIAMRSTLSQAVASREHNIEPGSPQTGHLMSALLMAAMSKLAAMRTSAPSVKEKADDTVTRLMRGLFGNLLTIAGSGVRPLSMVWQLFGLSPQYDIPTTDVDWMWYETVVALYPYTGWPLEQFHENLEKLLDKAIVRVVTKNENLAEIKQNRTADMIRACKLRNIQLEHSRTIITIFMRMLTEENIDVAAVATRLLEHLPRKLEGQTQGYTRMISYLDRLAGGGQRRAKEDLVAASIYTRRSATFAALKAQVSDACQTKDWVGVKQSCQALLDKRSEIATLWGMAPESLVVQNIKAYQGLLDADFGDSVDAETKLKSYELTRQALGDAEKSRVPWQIGKEGEFGAKMEPLDEAFVDEILTGTTPDTPVTEDAAKAAPETATDLVTREATDLASQFLEFTSVLRPGFINAMQKTLSAEDVCGLLKVPATTMRVFIKALNPNFVWEDLGENFRVVILGLLNNRSNRAESRPAKGLLELEGSRKALTDGLET
jgi:hypothetical protein